MTRRTGRIKISRNFIKDIHQTEISDLYSVFTHFIPVYIEDNPTSDDVIYWGYSYRFDEIEEGGPIPFYDAILTINDNGCSIEFKRIL